MEIHSGLDPQDFDLPTKWAVCPNCRGNGTTSAHLGAFTGEDMARLGREFRDDYMAGRYDRECRECNGRTTVQVVDTDRADAEALAEYRAELEAAYTADAMAAAERRVGA